MLTLQGKIGQGSLVSLTLRHHTRYFFIGPVQKKPQMQILLEAFMDNNSNRVAICKPGEPDQDLFFGLSKSDQGPVFGKLLVARVYGGCLHL